MYKQVVFDLDGTLIDSAPSILECLKLALKKINIDPIRPLDSSLIGPPLDLTLRKVSGIDDPELITNMIDCFKEAYDTAGYMASLPYEGASNMLKQLGRSSVSIYLATNKRITPTLKILDYFSWSKYFDSVYALDIGHIKFQSKADMLKSIIESNNFDPSKTLYVGDINADYLAAKSCNMKFIFAQWGYEEKGAFNYPDTASSIQDLTQKILCKL